MHSKVVKVKVDSFYCKDVLTIQLDITKAMKRITFRHVYALQTVLSPIICKPSHKGYRNIYKITI